MDRPLVEEVGESDDPPTCTACNVCFLRTLCCLWAQDRDNHKFEEINGTLPFLGVPTDFILGTCLTFP